MVCVPKDMVNPRGPLYSRAHVIGVVHEQLGRAEEPLNDLFDLTFAITPDAVISKLLFDPVGITDPGPFVSFGKEIAVRYGWGNDNVTMQDGFFVSESSLLGVELKLTSDPWPQQLVKYLALMVLEERHSHPREELGLLFIAPPQDAERFWRRCGLRGAMIDRGFLGRVQGTKINARIRTLMEDHEDHFNSVAERLKIALIMWADLRDGIREIMEILDQSDMGQQTLYRLLAGFLDQLESHGDTGLIVKP